MPDQQNQWCPRLDCWLREAWQEVGHAGDAGTYCRDYAIFPRRLFELAGSLSQEKKYDFCFIGSFKIRPGVAQARKWIMPFVRSHFTVASFLQFTDAATQSNHQSMGSFDRTGTRKGFVPREAPLVERGYLDSDYYRIMCHSRFALCPAGDAPWSMRFYEALLCKVMPIVNSPLEAARTSKEAQLGYKFLTTGDEFIYRHEWVEHNLTIAEKWHSLARS